MSNAYPKANIDLEEVSKNNDAARRIVAGFSASWPILTDIWRHLERALDDVPLLIAELRATRLDRANLLGAARATIAAFRDGERDFLFYLRDEVDAQNSLPPTSRGMHD
jgi:hypothetical protein